MVYFFLHKQSFIFQRNRDIKSFLILIHLPRPDSLHYFFNLVIPTEKNFPPRDFLHCFLSVATYWLSIFSFQVCLHLRRMLFWTLGFEISRCPFRILRTWSHCLMASTVLAEKSVVTTVFSHVECVSFFFFFECLKTFKDFPPFTANISSTNLHHSSDSFSLAKVRYV